MAELITPSNYQDFTLEMLKTPDGMTRLNGILRQLAQNISSDGEAVRVYQGYGTPEASVAAGIGSLYMRLDGGADTAVYRKESGSADTGWVAVKSPASLPLSVANGGFGADNSAVAQGYIPYMSATGVISWLAVGTSGQVLVTQGASANPAWGAGGISLISNTAVAAAAASTDIAITTTNYYKVFIHLGNLSAADTIAIRVNNSNAASYNWAFDGRTTGGALTGGGAGDTEIEISTVIVNNANSFLSTELLITPSDTNVLLFGGKSSFRENAGSLQAYVDFTGYSQISTPVSFRVITTGGATMTGNVLLYKLST